jgi:methyl-accepting chemotaxis protein
MLLAPMNGMIDVFARFKNEIGVGNMIGLAVGIAALGGAFLVFTAAMAGSSIVGGVGNIIGGILDGIGKLFGGDQPSPIEMIERLAVIAPSINKLAAPLLNLGRGFSMINAGAIMSIKGFQALSEMHDDIDVDDFKSQATSLRSIAGSYTGIANASKAMNIKAIMATTDMFKSLTDLAKNKGESAMSILAEKLMEAVKQLTGTITNLEKVADKQSENAAKAGDGIQKSLTVVNDSIAGVKKSADKLGAANKEGKLDLKPLIDAIQELESRFDRAIKVKVEGGSGSFLDM